MQFALSKTAIQEDISDSQVVTSGLSAVDYITDVINLPPSPQEQMEELHQKFGGN